MLVVNLFAGPGSGKTTLALLTAGYLKTIAHPRTVEYVSEYAKHLVWEERFRTMDNQVMILGRQMQSFRNLAGKVDIAITDGPMLHGAVYGRRAPHDRSFFELCLASHREYPSFNVFVERPAGRQFEMVGRIQDRAESIALDAEIRDMLREYGVAIDMECRPDFAAAVALAEAVLEIVDDAKAAKAA